MGQAASLPDWWQANSLPRGLTETALQAEMHPGLLDFLDFAKTGAMKLTFHGEMDMTAQEPAVDVPQLKARIREALRVRESHRRARPAAPWDDVAAQLAQLRRMVSPAPRRSWKMTVERWRYEGKCLAKRVLGSLGLYRDRRLDELPKWVEPAGAAHRKPPQPHPISAPKTFAQTLKARLTPKPRFRPQVVKLIEQTLMSVRHIEQESAQRIAILEAQVERLAGLVERSQEMAHGLTHKKAS